MYITSEKKIVLESSLRAEVATFLIFDEIIYLLKKSNGIICSHRSWMAGKKWELNP